MVPRWAVNTDSDALRGIKSHFAVRTGRRSVDIIINGASGARFAGNLPRSSIPSYDGALGTFGVCLAVIVVLPSSTVGAAGRPGVRILARFARRAERGWVGIVISLARSTVDASFGPSIGELTRVAVRT